jgi:hypothetical protein
MPAFGAAGNPVDVTGQFVARPELLRESVVALLDDPAHPHRHRLAAADDGARGHAGAHLLPRSSDRTTKPWSRLLGGGAGRGA